MRGCDQCPPLRGRARNRGARSGRIRAAVGQHLRQPNAVLVIKRRRPVIEVLDRGDRGLAVIELDEGDLGIGVDEGLLIDRPEAL